MSKTKKQAQNFIANNYYSHIGMVSYRAMAIVFASSLTLYSAKAEETKARLLPTVTVEADKEESYNVTESSLPKLTAPLRETPQSISVVSKKLIDDQGSTTVRDALRNIPGISIAAGEGGAQGDNLTIRGFTARSDIFLDGMRDFGYYFRDPFNLESVEVLKGPSSVLFGRGSTGGVINQSTKVPELKAFNQETAAIGTDMTRRITADVNQPLNNIGIEGAALRLNLMAHENEFTDRDVAENKRFGFAPSLALGLGTPLRLTLNYLHQEENNIPDYGQPFLFHRPAPVEQDNFYGFKNHDYFDTEADVGTAKVEYDLTDDLMLRNQLRIASYDRDFQATAPRISGSPTPSTPPSSITVNRSQVAIKSTESAVINQTDLTARFSTGAIDHTLVSGVELSHETSEPVRRSFTGVPTTNLVNPNPDQAFAGSSTVTLNVDAHADTVAVYALDTLNLSPQWDLIAGARFDHVESGYTQRAGTPANYDRTDNMLSWRGSLVYKPADNGSIYVSYGTSFNPSVENLALSASSANVDPEESQIYEIGTKWDWLNEKLSTSFAIFRDEKTNARTVDLASPSIVTLAGDQRVDGFEIEVKGQITEEWQVFGGYAFLDSEVIKSGNPAEKGNPLANVPKHSFTLFTTYTLPSKLQIGGGAKAVGERNATLTPDATTGIIKSVPGYVTFEAMARYPLAPNADLQLNIYNLTDTKYYDQVYTAHVVPGAGRTALLTARIQF